jgi:hypothetical protein
MTFAELQAEVLRRCARNEGGTQFDSAAETCINTSLFRISREAAWRSMRRKASLSTNAPYATGTGAVSATKGSKNITITGATLITDGIEVGRYIKFTGDAKFHKIETITGETTLTLQRAYTGTTTTTGGYQILGQEQYNLPIQAGHRMFLWHDEYGFPIKLKYLTDQEFYRATNYVYMTQIPLMYRMWGEDMVITQVRQPSVISVVSSSALDTSIQVTVFGVVAGYPDYEVINTNGTTAVAGSKVFQSVERIVKGGSSVGRITATANSGGDTVSVIPVGDTTSGIQYKKIQVWPLPTTAFPITVQYYKDPYKLVNDTDVPELGQEYDEAIILLASAKIRLDNNQEEADKYFTLYKDEISNLKKTNVDKIDWFPKMKRPGESDSLQIGRGLLYAQAGSQFGPASYF